MPRKAKEKIEELNTPKAIGKSTNTKKKKTETKTPAKKEVISNEKKSTTKSTTKKSTVKSKKVVTKTSSKATSSKSKTRKSSNTRNTKKKDVIPYSTSVEYYDLPFRYNQTVVKILAQTPNTLFIYWDISDEDKKQYKEKYGDNFFSSTKPILIITNKTMNYTFEVEINDFANSWYLHINDANCIYHVELGRRFIQEFNQSSDDSSNYYAQSENSYIYITSSNKIEAPNNHILIDELGKSVFFRNIKTNIKEEKDISSLSYLKNMGKIYNIYDLYKQMYQDELNSDTFGVDLPSSSNHSTFK